MAMTKIFSSILPALLPLLLLAAPCPLAAGPLRITIPAEVFVQTDIIVLGDLLPAVAPANVRALASNFRLGAAPQVGSSRNLSRDFLVSALNSVSLPLSSVDLPARGAVRRPSRQLSREGVAAAITAALRRSSTASSIDLRGLVFDASVSVSDSDPGIEVLETRIDELLGRARFRLAARSVPSLVPFFATASLSAATEPFSSPLLASRASRWVVAAAPLPAPLPVLVHPGTPARLHAHSANSDMQLVVNPLQRGRLGQVIQVQFPGTHKKLRARVVAIDALEASL